MLSVVILAAGQSKRMQSILPKVLHSLGGRPIIDYVIDAAQALNPSQIILVISKGLANHPHLQNYNTVIQEEAKGTGDALAKALPYINENCQEVLILCGDTPLIQTETLFKLSQSKTELAFTYMNLSKNSITQPYGRVLTDSVGIPKKIIEYKDATVAEQSISIANAGIYKIKKSLLISLLPKLNDQNEAKEYYLTDIVELAYNNHASLSLIEGSEKDCQGVNNRLDLAQAETELQNKWRFEKMQSGVTLLQPETIMLSYNTKIGQDSCIGPFVIFGSNVIIEKEVTVLPYCYLEHCHIKAGASVGPFTHIRGNTILEEQSSIGNFVEIKGSIIGKKSKAKHLSYIGDAEIGDKVNIGAGMITCNYDGFKKSKTVIGTQAMIGANTSLIAPLTIGEGSIVAAGSTVTESVPPDALVVARPNQIIKPSWAKKFRDKHSSKKKNS